MEARTLPAEMSCRRLTEVSSVQPLSCRRGDCRASLLMWMFHACRHTLVAVVPVCTLTHRRKGIGGLC